MHTWGSGSATSTCNGVPSLVVSASGPDAARTSGWSAGVIARASPFESIPSRQWLTLRRRQSALRRHEQLVGMGRHHEPVSLDSCHDGIGSHLGGESAACCSLDEGIPHRLGYGIFWGGRTPAESVGPVSLRTHDAGVEQSRGTEGRRPHPTEMPQVRLEACRLWLARRASRRNRGPLPQGPTGPPARRY
jgi:hypothetical protein